MTTADQEQTEATIQHHLAAVLAKDVSAILEDFSEDSVLFGREGPVEGLAALKGFFEGFVAGLSSELLATFTLARQDFDGELAYILWSAGDFIPLGTDTFVVRGGKIKYQTLAAYLG